MDSAVETARAAEDAAVTGIKGERAGALGVGGAGRSPWLARLSAQCARARLCAGVISYAAANPYTAYPTATTLGLLALPGALPPPSSVVWVGHGRPQSAGTPTTPASCLAAGPHAGTRRLLWWLTLGRFSSPQSVIKKSEGRVEELKARAKDYSAQVSKLEVTHWQGCSRAGAWRVASVPHHVARPHLHTPGAAHTHAQARLLSGEEELQRGLTKLK